MLKCSRNQEEKPKANVAIKYVELPARPRGEAQGKRSSFNNVNFLRNQEEKLKQKYYSIC
jgi:hypothetical protein